MSELPVLGSELGTNEITAAEATGRLRSVQQAALRLLAAGQTIEEAAEAAGVDRRTVSRWIHEDAEFGAAYNLWRRETLESGRAKVERRNRGIKLIPLFPARAAVCEFFRPSVSTPERIPKQLTAKPTSIPNSHTV